MSTQISELALRALLLAQCLLLAGCLDLPGGSGNSRPEVTRVVGNNVQIAGPDGYCIDKSATRDAASSAFVVMARCDALGDWGGASPSAPALLTVSVSGKLDDVQSEMPAAPLLTAFAKSEEGRAILSPDGQAASIDILDTKVRGDVFYLRARDNKVTTNVLLPEHWRAIFEIKGHLISARLNVFAKRPISSDTGFEMLNSLATRIKADNAVSEVATIPAATDAKAKTTVAPRDFFARIFR